MASVNKTPVIANPTYVLNLAHVKSAAYIRPFKRNALPWFQLEDKLWFKLGMLMMAVGGSYHDQQ
jgi:hypothetical protein